VMTIALIIVPLLPLHSGDREMLQYIPKWPAVIPLAAGLFLYYVQSDSMLQSIKTVTTGMLLLVILLHLSIAKPLHAIYDQALISEKIHQTQNEQGAVAVFPADLADQFQFAGKLTAPLIPQKTITDLASWSVEHAEGYCLILTTNKQYALLQSADGIAEQYSNGWLIFRPAKDFNAGYNQWLTQTTNSK